MRRYTGAFYKRASRALAEAIATGHVVILSGGYGIVRADEPIGRYNQALRLADWPAGLLEGLLVDEARCVGAKTVVAFAAASTGYATLLRRTHWRHAGLEAVLVTMTAAGVPGNPREVRGKDLQGAGTGKARRVGQGA